MRAVTRWLALVRGGSLVLAALLTGPTWPQLVQADWVNLTGAENAPNIAEIYITAEGIRVELEIFVDAIEAFSPLTKDGFTAIQFSTGTGEVLELSAIPVLERRFREDRYSPYQALGAAIPWATITPPPEDKRVYFAELHYRFEGQPDTITITPPISANGMAAQNIGMLVFHQNVPVIDFRFLSASETLYLDWNDPWYTKFANVNLGRHHQAALTSYLYVEPYEVRHEILIRPRDLAHWLDLSLANDRYIGADEFRLLLDRIGTFMLGRNPVTIDDVAVRPVLDQVEFVNIGLYGIQAFTPDQPLELNSAVIGLMLSYPTPGIPRQVRMTWDLFNERIGEVPTTAVDPAGPLMSYLTPDDPVLTWDNFLKRYQLPEVERVPVSATADAGMKAWVAALAFALLLLVAARAYRTRWTRPLGAAALVLLAAGTVVTALALLPRLTVKQLEPAEATLILETLLKNVYHAFYLRSDEDVYDKLALTVSGNLLEQVFLQQRQSFAVQAAGGAQARVNTVTLLESAYRSDQATTDALVYQTRWTATGAVSHWGHAHDRTNLYEALITISPSGELWKIMDLKILTEERVVQSSDGVSVSSPGQAPVAGQ